MHIQTIYIKALHVSAWLQTQDASPTSRKELEALGQLLIWLFVLVLVFLVGSLAIFRMSRRWRNNLLRQTPEPTPTDDIWAMNELPEGAVEAIPEDPTIDPAEDPRNGRE